MRLAVAALWQTQHDDSRTAQHSTHWMPVVLPSEDLDEWLFQGNEDREALHRILQSAPEDALVATPVSPRVNSVKNDDPKCVEPVEYELPTG